MVPLAQWQRDVAAVIAEGENKYRQEVLGQEALPGYKLYPKPKQSKVTT